MLRSFTRTARLARQFQTRAACLNAQVFRMPAMSPTMTEGGIVSWKLKAGEEFSSGDVLLEVETDKATIDVEATDDGIMWEVLRQDGENGIPVGQPIALLAEPGDDLATLEKPNLDAPEAAKPEAKSAEPEAKKEPVPEKKSSASLPLQDKASLALVGKANPALKVTPAVEILLHRNGISTEDAFAKIPASGPKGRLLKGDVLAYLGEIDSAAVAKVAEYIKNKEHLDLSNIKIAAPAATESAAGESKKDGAAAPAEKPKPSNVLTVEFTSELGEGVSAEKFKYAFERAVQAAKTQAHAARFPNYARSPLASGLYEDDIFGDLLVAPVSQDRFDVSNIAYKFIGAPSATHVPQADPFDELLGLSSGPAPVFATTTPTSLSAVVSFKITFDAKLTDSKDFVQYFQDALLSQIPSKQLIIHQ